MSLFTVENVTFRSKTAELVKGVSLSIERGTVTELEGESGNGKSLLLKLIGGVLVPHSGRVFFDGKDVALMDRQEDRDFRLRCAMVFQDGALWANQNILQNLMLPLKTHFPQMNPADGMERVEEVCSLVRYERPLTLRPAELSAGEQKRVAFARAIICRPEILLLDECTASLDNKGTATIRKLLHTFVDGGNTMIYISHSTTFINEFPGEVYHIKNGLVTQHYMNTGAK